MRGIVRTNQFRYNFTRGVQISTVFAIAIVVQELFRFRHAGWTGFALMMIYAGFDNGTTLIRAYDRFLGVLMGVFTGYILWFLGHLDFRLLYFLIPLTVFCVFFWAGTTYRIPTIFTVSTSIIAFGYFDSQSAFVIGFFVMDYAMCTLIAFAIILVCEHFWFRHYRLMHRFIRDIQGDVIDNLYVLINLLEQVKIRRTDWFKACTVFTCNLTEMNRLTLNAQFKASSEEAVGDEFNQFAALTGLIFTHLKALYIAYYTERYRKYDYNQLVEQVQAELLQLKSLVAEEQRANVPLGVFNAAPG